MNQPVLFSGGIASNFHRAPIVMYDLLRHRERVFPGNEWYFHVVKILLAGDFTVVIDGQGYGPYELYDAIADAPTPVEAKRLGRLVPLDADQVEQWNQQAALVAMLECNLAKYQQNPECRRWLVATGTAPLVEHRPDPIWGDGMDGTGRNLLGKTLEVVRALVR